LCKRIIERPGGSIWLESQPDEDWAFYFSIPETARETAPG
jgi:light-regulated signal transduction histidine kinase (bacteriophytochrome)